MNANVAHYFQIKKNQFGGLYKKFIQVRGNGFVVKQKLISFLSIKKMEDILLQLKSFGTDKGEQKQNLNRNNHQN